MIPARFADLAAREDLDPLSRALIDQGYAIVRGAVPQGMIETIKDEMGDRFDKTPFSVGAFHGEWTKRFHGLLKRAPTSQKLAMHEQIVTAARAILGKWCDFPQLNLSQGLSIYPGAPAQIPHRDQTMWPAPKGEMEFSFNVMWPLDDFTEHNGATKVWPDTHHEHATYKMSVDDLGEPLVAEMKRGDVFVFLGSVLHAAGSNRSVLPRRGIIISYSLGWLRTYENQNLTYDRDFARTLDPELAAMIGYRWQRPNLGTFDGQCPSVLLGEEVPDYLPTVDSFTPAQKVIVDTHLLKELAAADAGD
ncbi:phytanoyl-CoA dioxygenase family protein [Sphingomonas solaris]|uniref:Phytanoyl-CoA dioxygenase family protein n=1 Tax=Alterirhizorhabdus solaris TaxID=2529389 RepID=A0A558R010_9SPHN|nr:phytanoyl-CoA dioxygenase family protein [Sphingomonas solaris]TVV72678.1 phytanoyl-CoA dioxygenase family protein [Sphingomonas solaris]